MSPRHVHFNGSVNLADSESVMREIVARVPAGLWRVRRGGPARTCERSCELRRAITELGFKGVLVNGYTNDSDLEHGRSGSSATVTTFRAMS